MITNITITNVKGFGTTDNSIDVEIKEGKINLLIAPNGFGKSSISAAFNSLNENRMVVEKEDVHNGDKYLESSLSLVLDGTTYTADKDKNEIEAVIDSFVIKNRLISTASPQKFKGKLIANAKMEVKPIVIRTSFPEKCKLEYKYAEVAKAFGKNGRKVLVDLSSFLDSNNFADEFYKSYGLIENLDKGENKKNYKAIVNQINTIKGSRDKLVSSVNQAILDLLIKNVVFIKLVDQLDNFNPDKTDLGKFGFFFQLLYLWLHKKENLKKMRARRDFEKTKSKFKNLLNSCDTTDGRVQLEEIKGQLVIKFPKGSSISNGQRDIITFIAQLMLFKSRMSTDKPSLLVIDEVFDYLDDANVVAAQYFLSTLLEQHKDKLYVVLLSHLGPEKFRCYALKKYLWTCCIKPVVAKSSESMKEYIRFRQSVKQTNQQAYDDLSHYYFHYAPDTETKDFTAYHHTKANLKRDWFKNLNLHKYLIEQLNKYLSNGNDYDPYAVCFALRLACEKNIFVQLSDAQKKDFLNTKMTRGKLQWAENEGVNIPFTYYLLGIIYNDADHLRDDEKDRDCVYKLDNLAIRQMVRAMFDSIPVTIKAIAK